MEESSVDLSALRLQELMRVSDLACACGRRHSAPRCDIIIESGAINRVAQMLLGAKARRPFVVMDDNTRRAAGDAVMGRLKSAGVDFSLCVLPGEPRVLPNEEFLACILDAFDPRCDLVLGVGSGVINDLCKMVGKEKGLRTGIVATAPSMDGYASNSAAMELGGVKTTVYTEPPCLILCDTAVMRNAPMDMLRSGFGDMAAKLVSITDWRVARLVTGEYYCDSIARMMLRAYRQAVDACEGLLQRREDAVGRLTEGLILSGVASALAGVSRPASGVEHTISHLLEMFALSQGKRPAFHGIQVGYGTRAALRLYRVACRMKPTAESCQAAYDAFDPAAWERDMRRTFGVQADALISLSDREKRNSRDAFEERSQALLCHWEEIASLMDKAAQDGVALEAAMDKMGLPALDKPQEMGYTPREIRDAVLHSRDLRSRYVLSSLCWDAGLMPALEKEMEGWFQ